MFSNWCFVWMKAGSKLSAVPLIDVPVVALLPTRLSNVTQVWAVRFFPPPAWDYTYFFPLAWDCTQFFPEPGIIQGWEFAHRFSERIARLLQKNEQMSDSL